MYFLMNHGYQKISTRFSISFLKYFVLQKIEEWESEETEEDLLEFVWEKSKSKKNINEFITKIGKSIESKVFKQFDFSSLINFVSINKDIKQVVNNYAGSLKKIFDEGEDKENMKLFKENVLRLLELKSEESNKLEKAKSV